MRTLPAGERFCAESSTLDSFSFAFITYRGSRANKGRSKMFSGRRWRTGESSPRKKTCGGKGRITYTTKIFKLRKNSQSPSKNYKMCEIYVKIIGIKYSVAINMKCKCEISSQESYRAAVSKHSVSGQLGQQHD